jgi:hypothetical protein
MRLVDTALDALVLSTLGASCGYPSASVYTLHMHDFEEEQLKASYTGGECHVYARHIALKN